MLSIPSAPPAAVEVCDLIAVEVAVFNAIQRSDFREVINVITSYPGVINMPEFRKTFAIILTRLNDRNQDELIRLCMCIWKTDASSFLQSVSENEDFFENLMHTVSPENVRALLEIVSPHLSSAHWFIAIETLFTTNQMTLALWIIETYAIKSYPHYQFLFLDAFFHVGYDSRDGELALSMLEMFLSGQGISFTRIEALKSTFHLIKENEISAAEYLVFCGNITEVLRTFPILPFHFLSTAQQIFTDTQEIFLDEKNLRHLLRPYRIYMELFDEAIVSLGLTLDFFIGRRSDLNQKDQQCWVDKLSEILCAYAKKQIARGLPELNQICMKFAKKNQYDFSPHEINILENLERSQGSDCLEDDDDEPQPNAWRCVPSVGGYEMFTYRIKVMEFITSRITLTDTAKVKEEGLFDKFASSSQIKRPLPKIDFKMQLDFANLKLVGKLTGGSHACNRYSGARGGQWVLKEISTDPRTNPKLLINIPSSQQLLQVTNNEILAGLIYQACGIPTPLMAQAGNFVASQYYSCFTKLSKQEWAALDAKKYPSLYSGFVVDLWLGNYDVLGEDGCNVVFLKDGTPLRLDVGGALNYYPLGEKKSREHFNEMPSSIFTGLHAELVHTVFLAEGKLEPAHILEGIKRIQSIALDKLYEIIRPYLVIDELQETVALLEKRRTNLINLLQEELPRLPIVLQPSAATCKGQINAYPSLKPLEELCFSIMDANQKYVIQSDCLPHIIQIITMLPADIRSYFLPLFLLNVLKDCALDSDTCKQLLEFLFASIKDYSIKTKFLDQEVSVFQVLRKMNMEQSIQGREDIIALIITQTTLEKLNPYQIDDHIFNHLLHHEKLYVKSFRSNISRPTLLNVNWGSVEPLDLFLYQLKRPQFRPTIRTPEMKAQILKGEIPCVDSLSGAVSWQVRSGYEGDATDGIQKTGMKLTSVSTCDSKPISYFKATAQPHVLLFLKKSACPSKIDKMGRPRHVYLTNAATGRRLWIDTGNIIKKEPIPKACSLEDLKKFKQSFEQEGRLPPHDELLVSPQYADQIIAGVGILDIVDVCDFKDLLQQVDIFEQSKSPDSHFSLKDLLEKIKITHPNFLSVLSDFIANNEEIDFFSLTPEELEWFHAIQASSDLMHASQFKYCITLLQQRFKLVPLQGIYYKLKIQAELQADVPMQCVSTRGVHSYSLADQQHDVAQALAQKNLPYELKNFFIQHGLLDADTWEYSLEKINRLVAGEVSVLTHNATAIAAYICQNRWLDSLNLSEKKPQLLQHPSIQAAILHAVTVNADTINWRGCMHFLSRMYYLFPESSRKGLREVWAEVSPAKQTQMLTQADSRLSILLKNLPWDLLEEELLLLIKTAFSLRCYELGLSFISTFNLNLRSQAIRSILETALFQASREQAIFPALNISTYLVEDKMGVKKLILSSKAILAAKANKTDIENAFNYGWQSNQVLFGQLIMQLRIKLVRSIIYYNYLENEAEIEYFLIKNPMQELHLFYFLHLSQDKNKQWLAVLSKKLSMHKAVEFLLVLVRSSITNAFPRERIQWILSFFLVKQIPLPESLWDAMIETKHLDLLKLLLSKYPTLVFTQFPILIGKLINVLGNAILLDFLIQTTVTPLLPDVYGQRKQALGMLTHLMHTLCETLSEEVMHLFYFAKTHELLIHCNETINGNTQEAMHCAQALIPAYLYLNKNENKDAFSETCLSVSTLKEIELIDALSIAFDKIIRTICVCYQEHQYLVNFGSRHPFNHHGIGPTDSANLLSPLQLDEHFGTQVTPTACGQIKTKYQDNQLVIQCLEAKSSMHFIVNAMQLALHLPKDGIRIQDDEIIFALTAMELSERMRYFRINYQGCMVDYPNGAFTLAMRRENQQDLGYTFAGGHLNAPYSMVFDENNPDKLFPSIGILIELEEEFGFIPRTSYGEALAGLEVLAVEQQVMTCRINGELLKLNKNADAYCAERGTPFYATPAEFVPESARLVSLEEAGALPLREVGIQAYFCYRQAQSHRFFKETGEAEAMELESGSSLTL